MKIGDVSPFPPDADIGVALRLQASRGRMAKIATMKGCNQFTNGARKIINGLAENRARDRDPFERAKTFLGRKGYAVFALSVREPKAKGYVVGGRTMPDRASVTALARRLGWSE